MEKEQNPYEAPQALDETSAATRWKQRLWNVWVFAMIWPFVATLFHRYTLPLIPMLGSEWLFICWSPYLIGHAVCIIAAIRYSASVWWRLLRWIGSVALMFVFIRVANVVFGLIRWSIS